MVGSSDKIVYVEMILLILFIYKLDQISIIYKFINQIIYGVSSEIC